MGWEYDPSALATSAKDRVRLAIGDTDAAAPLLQDEEITFAITEEGDDELRAAARCCEQISRFFLRKPDVRLGRSLELKYASMAKQYAEMAAELRKRAIGTAIPYAGGRLLSEKTDLASDTGAVQPLFTKTLHRNPGRGGLRGED
jgi:hypothetical protein